VTRRAGPYRAVLTYHSIDSSGSPISITPAAFAAHVRRLASDGTRVLPLAALIAESRDDVESDQAAVALTFDDGFENFATHAAPLLLDAGLPATIFVVSRSVGGTNAWNGKADPGVPVLPLLGWDAIGRLADGGVDIGAHTRTHPSLQGRSPDELTAEIEGSAEDIARHCGRRPATFAYPYGIAPPSAATIVRRQFACGVTTRMSRLRPGDDAALLPRLDAYYLRQPSGLDGWGTARFRGYVRLRAAARSIRRWVQ
jgi:peptidoglycan/xylan/chitin deacetylase (PgdA/CDA1 family)